MYVKMSLLQRAEALIEAEVFKRTRGDQIFIIEKGLKCPGHDMIEATFPGKDNHVYGGDKNG